MTERSPRGPRRPGGEHDERDFPGGLFAVDVDVAGQPQYEVRLDRP